MKLKHTDFKVGDKVTCISNGKGKVIDIREDIGYPVIVLFDNSFGDDDDKEEAYTYDGRFFKYTNVVLSKGHLDLEIVAKEPEPKFKKGDHVMVRDSDSDYWHSDVFNHIQNTKFKYACERGGWKQCITIEEFLERINYKDND